MSAGGNDVEAAGCVPCEVCGGSQTRSWHRHGAPARAADEAETMPECGCDDGVCTAVGSDGCYFGTLPAQPPARRAEDVLAEVRALGATWEGNATYSRTLIENNDLSYVTEQLALMAAETHERCVAELTALLDADGGGSDG